MIAPSMGLSVYFGLFFYSSFFSNSFGKFVDRALFISNQGW